ncbi:MAG: ribokinase, partial [Anaerolineae bacterium]|nr:ribokinase [Anaerolineae bacterium]
MPPAPVDYLVIGHVAHDETPDGPQLGGTAAYSARLAQALGLRVGVLTSAHPADPVLPALDGLAVHLVPAESSTIFVNRYTDAGRQQIVRGHARRLAFEHLPESWRAAPVVHLGPITPGLDPDLLPARFPGALVGVTPQGFMRAWGEDGVVYPVPWASAETMLPHAVTVLSDEDLGHDPTLEAQYAAQARALVVTRNYAGATLYRDGTR